MFLLSNAGKFLSDPIILRGGDTIPSTNSAYGNQQYGSQQQQQQQQQTTAAPFNSLGNRERAQPDSLSVQDKSLQLHLDEWARSKQFTAEQYQLMGQMRQELLLYLESLPDPHPQFPAQQQNQQQSISNSFSYDRYNNLDNMLFFCRFCEAREWKPKESMDMFRKHLIWRRDLGLDQPKFMQDVFSPEMQHNLWKLKSKFFVNSKYHKTDKYGRPIYYDRLGSIDANALFEDVPLSTLTYFFVWQHELTLRHRLPAASLQKQQIITESLYVIDLDGLSLAKSFTQSTRQLLSEISDIGQNHYPQTMGSVIIVNAPLSFRVIWAFLSPMLPARVKDYIFIHGSDYMSKLTEFVDIDDVPNFLNGNDFSFGGDQQQTQFCDTNSQHQTQDTEYGPWSAHLPSILV